MEVIKFIIIISIITIILLLLLYLYYIDSKINKKIYENKNILIDISENNNNNNESKFIDKLNEDNELSNHKNKNKFITKKSFDKKSNYLNLCIDGSLAVFNKEKYFNNKLCYCNYDNLCLTSNDIDILRKI